DVGMCRSRRPAAPESSEPLKQLPSAGLTRIVSRPGCGWTGCFSSAIRVPALRTYNSDTPYETVIDVGGCSRSKGSPGCVCVCVCFDSVSVETPNKVDLIQTVTACELKETCYRVPYVEYYYEIVHHADGVKERDVGRCLGGCATGSRCLLSSPTDPQICHLWSEKQPSSCVPQGYESHSFFNQHGQIRTVLSITSCLCQN
uniref:Pinhead n=1 Tax=Amphiprion percula TaxID=161767 RepID=A0A3P8U983_AMPPE